MTKSIDHSLTVIEASARLGMSPKTIHRWIQENKVRAWKVTEDGHEKWYVDLDNGPFMSKSDDQDVLLEKDTVIYSLKEEMATLRVLLREKDAQIRELHVLLQQQGQLPEPNKRPWWAFWRRQ
jgi:excisionase family DNA binding protein